MAAAGSKLSLPTHPLARQLHKGQVHRRLLIGRHGVHVGVIGGHHGVVAMGEGQGRHVLRGLVHLHCPGRGWNLEGQHVALASDRSVWALNLAFDLQERVLRGARGLDWRLGCACGASEAGVCHWLAQYSDSTLRLKSRRTVTSNLATP